MLSAHTLSNRNNCLTSFLFNVVILWLTEMVFAANACHLQRRLWDTQGWPRGRAFRATQQPQQQTEASFTEQAVGCLPARCPLSTASPSSIFSSSSWPCSLRSGRPVPPRMRDSRLPLAPAPARLCPAPRRSGGCRKVNRGESLSPPLLRGHASPKPFSSHCRAAFLAKQCSLVPLCCSSVIFKDRLALFRNYYCSKDPLHEVGLSFLHH